MYSRSPEIAPTDHAVILAAGRGSRLEPEEDYKLLVEIDGIPLLERHLRNFERLGIRDVTVVTGYRHEALDRRIRNWESSTNLELHVAVNPAFDGGNGLSVLAGIDQARREAAVEGAVPFWLTMSDHLFDPAIFEALDGALSRGEGAPGALLVVDGKLERVYDLEDANKLRRDDDGALEAIGKDLERFDCVDTGLFWCGEEFVRALDATREERGDCTTSDAVRELADGGSMELYDLGDGLWQDIDTPGAREHAEGLAASGAFGVE